MSERELLKQARKFIGEQHPHWQTWDEGVELEALAKKIDAALAAAPAAPAQEPVAHVNGDELDNMLDDRTATIQRLPSFFRKTPLYAAPAPAVTAQSFQQRVQPWMMACFGPVIAGDRIERNHRFLEEALELVQSCGCTRDEAHQLVDYVYGRPQGQINQEVGGVMVTLAALCLANGIDMHEGGETELARINEPATIEKIRVKQAAKPRHSPLPAVAAQGDERQALLRIESMAANAMQADDDPMTTLLRLRDEARAALAGRHK